MLARDRDIRIIQLIFDLVLLLCFIGSCAAQDPKINVNDLANTLYTELSFEDQLTETNDDMIAFLYGVSEEDVVESKVYISAGATTEEIAIFRCSSKEAVQRITEAAENRLASQRTSVQSYKLEELSRLEDAVLRIEGTYVILCVSNDHDGAQKIIDNALK